MSTTILSASRLPQVPLHEAGFCVERLELEEYVDSNFHAPPGLRRTLYAPLRGNAHLPAFVASDCAATEPHGNTRCRSIHVKNARTRIAQGEVEDEKACYSMKQIAGHAGLFSTAEQAAEREMMMLDGGIFDGQAFFDAETIAAFARPDRHDPSFGRGLRL